MNPSKLNRRLFMGLSMAATFPLFLGKTLCALGDESSVGAEEILVVIQLSGGNDGLNTLVPYGDDAYGQNRRGLLIDKPLKIDEYVGLNPNLDKLLPLYKDGKMAIVQGVSYPNPNRSHFKAMDIWHTGDMRGRGVETGWLGRAIDARCPSDQDPNLVINVGTSVPYALNAKVHKPVSFDQTEAYQWRGRDRKEFDELNQKQHGMSNLDWLHRVAANARSSSSTVRRAARNYKAKGNYPQRNQLAGQLRTVASLIVGKLRTRVFYVSMGGFDTHVRQKNTHDRLMRQFGDAVAAFLDDLKQQGVSKRVLVTVFSEFGRRVTENGSQGTDHGVAGPMFLIGDRVKGGLKGKYPSLTDLDKGDLKMSVDFRQVYASILEDWVKIPSKQVLGKQFTKLDLL